MTDTNTQPEEQLVFELTLRGYCGDTDLTDHLIVLIETKMTERQLTEYLSDAGLFVPDGIIEDITPIQDDETSFSIDFSLPDQVEEFKAHAIAMVIENDLLMKPVIEKILDATDNHGEDSGDFNHTVGDLRDLMREAWGLMTLDQRRKMVKSTRVADVVECGARDEFDVDDLLKTIDTTLESMEASLAEAGYDYLANKNLFMGNCV